LPRRRRASPWTRDQGARQEPPLRDARVATRAESNHQHDTAVILARSSIFFTLSPSGVKGGRSMKIFLGCVLAIASVATVSAQETRVVTQSPPQGRFQIVFGPMARADTYLLDTHTGQIWQSVKLSDLQGEPLVRYPMDRFDSSEEIAAFYKARKPKTATHPAPSQVANSPRNASAPTR
jgi:hypothetical protein